MHFVTIAWHNCKSWLSVKYLLKLKDEATSGTTSQVVSVMDLTFSFDSRKTTIMIGFSKNCYS